MEALSSFLFRPLGIHFESQGKSEIIILFLRAHFVTNVPWILLSLVLLIAPIVLFPLFPFVGTIPPEQADTLITFFVLVWYLLTFSYMLVNFLLWYFNVSIVTNQRIVDIDYINILQKELSATTIEKIEDVTMKRGGFLRAIFNFGDVYVQTAGSLPNFEVLGAPRPEEVVRIINQLMDEHKNP